MLHTRTVREDLSDLDYDGIRQRIVDAVEIDGEICPKTSFPDRQVEDCTSFEVVTFVGGG